MVKVYGNLLSFMNIVVLMWKVNSVVSVVISYLCGVNSVNGNSVLVSIIV